MAVFPLQRATLANRRLHDIGALRQPSSGEWRREQLVKIAAYIVEFEGLDELRHARIAEIAGCARPLVYKYFPRKSDIYIAISEAFYQRLEERFSCEQQYEVVRGVLDGGSEDAVAMETLIWDVLDEFGCAGLILRSVPEINETFHEYHEELKQRYEYRWLRYFMELDLPEKRAALLLENCVGIARNVARAYMAGDFERDESLHMVLDQMAALIRREVAVAKQIKQTN